MMHFLTACFQALHSFVPQSWQPEWAAPSYGFQCLEEQHGNQYIMWVPERSPALGFLICVLPCQVVPFSPHLLGLFWYWFVFQELSFVQAGVVSASLSFPLQISAPWKSWSSAFKVYMELQGEGKDWQKMACLLCVTETYSAQYFSSQVYCWFSNKLHCN